MSGWNPKSGVGMVQSSRLVQSSLGPDCLESISTTRTLAQGPAGHCLSLFSLLESSWSLVCSVASTAVAAAANAAAGSSPKTKKLWAWAVLPAAPPLTWFNQMWTAWSPALGGHNSGDDCCSHWSMILEARRLGWA